MDLLPDRRSYPLVNLSHAVCAEAFNPDEDEEDKEPLVSLPSKPPPSSCL